MFRALYTAASGMNTQQLKLDNVANNLANTSTAGFRRRRVQFTDLLYRTWSCRAQPPRSRPLTLPDCRLVWVPSRALPKSFSYKAISVRLATLLMWRFKVRDFSRSGCRMVSLPILALALSTWMHRDMS